MVVVVKSTLKTVAVCSGSHRRNPDAHVDATKRNHNRVVLVACLLCMHVITVFPCTVVCAGRQLIDFLHMSLQRFHVLESELRTDTTLEAFS